MVLRVAAHALAVERNLHLRQNRIAVDILLHRNAVAPLAVADPGDAAVRRTARAVVANIVREYIVARIRQMLVLDDKVDLDLVKAAERLAEMSRETRAEHRQRMVEDDELIARPSLCRNVPRVERNTVNGRNEALLVRHAVDIRRLSCARGAQCSQG